MLKRLRKGTLKILAVEASMIFLAITVKGIAAENETAHAQRIVVNFGKNNGNRYPEPVEPETSQRMKQTALFIAGTGMRTRKKFS